MDQETDLVITINVPHIPGSYAKDGIDHSKGKNGQLLDDAVRYRDRILETLDIRDWALFVQGDE